MRNAYAISMHASCGVFWLSSYGFGFNFTLCFVRQSTNLTAGELTKKKIIFIEWLQLQQAAARFVRCSINVHLNEWNSWIQIICTQQPPPAPTHALAENSRKCKLLEIIPPDAIWTILNFCSSLCMYSVLTPILLRHALAVARREKEEGASEREKWNVWSVIIIAAS